MVVLHVLSIRRRRSGWPAVSKTASFTQTGRHTQHTGMVGAGERAYWFETGGGAERREGRGTGGREMGDMRHRERGRGERRESEGERQTHRQTD